jgi:predicted nucleotidyltransferase
MTDQLKELKERVDFLEKQLERMEVSIKEALKTGETSKAKTIMEELLSETLSTKEYAKALLIQYKKGNNYYKADYCKKLLKCTGEIEELILALKEL